MTGAIIGTAIVFFPAAPLFLFMHGKDITIPKGTEITAYINEDRRFEAIGHGRGRAILPWTQMEYTIGRNLTG